MAKKEIIKAVKKQEVKKTSAKTAKKIVAPKQVANGRFYITATFNNTLVTLTDTSGNALAWSTAGASGFKGARKGTPYAAITAVESVIRKARSLGMVSAEVYLKGPGPGRDAAIRALRGAGLNILMIADVTPIPHNGIRAKKKRRV